MSLRSVSLIFIKVKFPAACCDKISFTLDYTPRLAARGSLMVFLELMRRRRTLNIQSSIDNIQLFEDSEDIPVNYICHNMDKNNS
jgi:hypothetical protein